MDMKIPVIVFIMSLLMLFAATPTFAAPPPMGTYTQVVVSHSVGPAEQRITGDIVHIRDGIGECYLYGAAFPLGNSVSSSTTTGGQLNLVSFTGNWIEHVVDTYVSGTVEGIVNIKFNGFDSYVYSGPTFTFTLGTVTATLTTGDVFYGILFEGVAVKYGTGDLTGFTIQGRMTGVSIYAVIVGDLNMMGLGLSFETGRYSGP